MTKSLAEEIEQLERLIASAGRGSTQFNEAIGSEPLRDITHRRIDEMRARLSDLKAQPANDRSDAASKNKSPPQ